MFMTLKKERNTETNRCITRHASLQPVEVLHLRTAAGLSTGCRRVGGGDNLVVEPVVVGQRGQVLQHQRVFLVDHLEGGRRCSSHYSRVVVLGQDGDEQSFPGGRIDVAYHHPKYIIFR